MREPRASTVNRRSRNTTYLNKRVYVKRKRGEKSKVFSLCTADKFLCRPNEELLFTTVYQRTILARTLRTSIHTCIEIRIWEIECSQYKTIASKTDAGLLKAKASHFWCLCMFYSNVLEPRKWVIQIEFLNYTLWNYEILFPLFCILSNRLLFLRV